MMNTYNNLTKVLKPFENKWVALTRDYKKVIDYGDTLNEVTSKIKKNEKDKIIFYKVVPPNFVPWLL